jgi:hypothetical protein
MAKADKAGLMEQYGVAVNSSSLRIGRLPGEAEIERPLDRVAAMGMASLSIRHGDQEIRRQVHIPLPQAYLPVQRVPRGLTTSISHSLTVAASAYKPAPRSDSHLVGELAPILWRLKAGNQLGFMGQATQLFARWLSTSGRFHPITGGEAGYPKLIPFARRVLAEWVHERCSCCGGSGKLQLTSKGPRRTLGSNARNTKFVLCKVCHGSGKALGKHAERAQEMGLTLAAYDEAKWPGHYTAASIALDRLAHRLNKHLRREMERG